MIHEWKTNPLPQFLGLTGLQCGFIPHRLENTALLLADELSAHQALAVGEALEETHSRNLSLLNK